MDKKPQPQPQSQANRSNNNKPAPAKKNDIKDQYRVNDRIRAKEVRLVGDNVEQGVYTIQEAMHLADEQGLDLIEISPNAVPPVCKILDYQKFLYQQKKRSVPISGTSPGPGAHKAASTSWYSARWPDQSAGPPCR